VKVVKKIFAGVGHLQQGLKAGGIVSIPKQMKRNTRRGRLLKRQNQTDQHQRPSTNKRATLKLRHKLTRGQPNYGCSLIQFNPKAAQVD